MFDYVDPRPNEQVVGISENNLRVEFAQLARTHRFHAALRSDRHKRRRFDGAVRSEQPAVARLCLSILRQNLERFLHRLKGSAQSPRKTNSDVKYSLRRAIFSSIVGAHR